MNFELIATRKNKKVYRDGDKSIKVFDAEYSKSDILNEALNQARIEETGLNIPKLLGVNMIDGKWAIVNEGVRSWGQLNYYSPSPYRLDTTSGLDVTRSGLLCPFQILVDSF